MGQFERRIRAAASCLFRAQSRVEESCLAEGKRNPAIAVYEYYSKPNCDMRTGEVAFDFH